MPHSPKISPLGDCCVTVDFGNEISVPLNSAAIALASTLNAKGFPGFVEAVPAFASVAVYFDLAIVRRETSDFSTAFDAVQARIVSALGSLEDVAEQRGTLIEIPVDFSDGAALDMASITESRGLSVDDVVGIYTSRTYRVYMVGFLPGFAYMGEVDERIAVPRHASPRTRVPKGSVGIAGRQTGIYPFASPGGWKIIGRTNVEMFTPDGEHPTLLKPGDEVKFVAI